jgi:hypothetical protein
MLRHPGRSPVREKSVSRSRYPKVQFTLKRYMLLSNAKFTGKRRLSSQEDAGSEVLSPGARMAAIPRLSGATSR